MAAVKALALVAHKLYGTCQEAADGDASQAATTAAAADPAAAVLLREHVLKALLVAVEDYSTDNRSDLTSQHSQDSCASRIHKRLCYDAKDGLLATLWLPCRDACMVGGRTLRSMSTDSRRTPQTNILRLWQSFHITITPQVILHVHLAYSTDCLPSFLIALMRSSIICTMPCVVRALSEGLCSEDIWDSGDALTMLLTCHDVLYTLLT